MMCADFLNLRAELDLFAARRVALLHMDVMDGAYVPNFALGPDFCRACAGACAVPHDVHLMVENPDRHLAAFAGLPGLRISFHPETSRHPVATLDAIRKLGASPGIALDPAMPVDAVRHLLPLADLVCVMTVNPGYAGQKLVPHCLKKIAELRSLCDSLGIRPDIEVDGNVSWENIPAMVRAGANILVCGTSSLFDKSLARDDAIRKLRALLDALEAE